MQPHFQKGDCDLHGKLFVGYQSHLAHCNTGTSFTFIALIAAVALRYDLILLTTDKDFQPVVGLTQHNWLAI